jgi:hypothetical protein
MCFRLGFRVARRNPIHGIQPSKGRCFLFKGHKSFTLQHAHAWNFTLAGVRVIPERVSWVNQTGAQGRTENGESAPQLSPASSGRLPTLRGLHIQLPILTSSRMVSSTLCS